MSLKAIVDTVEELDSGLLEHYKKDEKSGKFVLDLEGFDGMPQVKRLKDEAAQHRIKAREAEDKFKPFSSLGSIDELQAKLDRIPELEAAAKGKLDQAQIDQLVDTRIKGKLAPLERERDQLKGAVAERDQKIGEYTQAEVRRKVNHAVTKAAREAKVTDSAVDDIELYGERLFEVQEDGSVVTKDGVGVTPGLSPKQWLEDMQGKRPHWWGTTAGGGAAGNRGGGATGGVNPWSAEHWNMTEQGAILRTKGREHADRLAKAAGTTVGGKRPVKKAA
jgi:hypothetical protein